MAAQQIEGPGQGQGGGLVPGGDEGQEVVGDVGVIQSLACFWILGVEHERQQVVAPLACLTALGHALAHHVAKIEVATLGAPLAWEWRPGRGMKG